MKHLCTGVILAGGQNTRFSGQNKAFITVQGRRILDRIADVLQTLFDEILIVTNDPLAYSDWNYTIVSDIVPVRSSLTGIHAGLFYASHPYAFMTACDAPFLKKELIQLLVNAVESHIDVVIPQTSSGFEPLCAVYSKQCLKPIEQQLSEGKFKIQNFFRKVRIKTIEETLLREKDPRLTSFININTPHELLTYEQEAP